VNLGLEVGCSGLGVFSFLRERWLALLVDAWLCVFAVVCHGVEAGRVEYADWSSLSHRLSFMAA
jgi:hypothetical protein